MEARRRGKSDNNASAQGVEARENARNNRNERANQNENSSDKDDPIEDPDPTDIPPTEVVVTQLPTETPIILPTETPLPLPTQTPLPQPTETPLPLPTQTSLPQPTETPLPLPTATPLPLPTATPLPLPTSTPQPPTASTIQFDYGINRAGIPQLSFYDLSYIVTVGNEGSVQVLADGSAISYVRDGDRVLFTTSADNISVIITDPASSVSGDITISPLKDYKSWAWSHSLDDNVYLNNQIDAFESRGYRGTFYLIARDVYPNRNESWTLDEDQLVDLINRGWSVGNHTWAHECRTDGIDYVGTVNLGYDRLYQIMTRTNRPEYRLTAFAAPCFDDNYHPVIMQMRNEQSSAVLFNESGGGSIMNIAPNATNVIQVGSNFAQPFSFDAPVGRDSAEGDAYTNVIANFNSISLTANPDNPIWYNTFSHGRHESSINAMLDHLDNNYRQEIWAAPADEIYSYVMLRDNVQIVTEVR